MSNEFIRVYTRLEPRSSPGRTLTVTSPWHGYHLGDWTETWEKFAKRAAAGDWELSGLETLARQRTGVMPETGIAHRTLVAARAKRSHNRRGVAAT